MVKPVDLFSPIQQVQNFAAGTTLYRQGETPTGCFIIRRGQVALSVSVAGSDQLVHSAKAGELLALETVISAKPHETTASTCTDCELGFLEREQLLAYLQANTSNCFPVLQLLSDHLNSTYQSVRSINTGARKRSALTAV